MGGKRDRRAVHGSAGHVHGPGCNHDHAGDGLAPSQSKTPGEFKLNIHHRSDDAEQRSKDELFVRLALIAQSMIGAHGKDFAMGALVLSARFIAEGKPLVKSESPLAGAATAAASNG